MLMRTICPLCDAGLEIDRYYAHGEVTCGQCGRVFVAEPAEVRRRTRTRHKDEWDDRPHRLRRRRSDGSGWAIGSLVLGITSAVIFCLWPLGLMVATAGLAMGAYGLKSPARRMAVVGLVFSMLGLTFAAGIGVTMIVAIVASESSSTPPLD